MSTPLPPPLSPFQAIEPEPPSPGDGDDPSHDDAERSDDPAGRRSDAVLAATWMAAVGALLVLAAASVLVVGNWNHIDPTIKLAGLVAANGVIAAAAAALRRVSPVVSRALGHLAAMLAVPSGVAVMAAAHQHWPNAIAVGGLAGVLACATQARRLRAPLLELAAEGASVVALAGIGTLAHAPLGVLVGALALVAMFARRDVSAAPGAHP